MTRSVPSGASGYLSGTPALTCREVGAVLRRFGALLALALCLSGCVNITAKMNIDRQGQGRGDVTLEFSKQTAAYMNAFSAEQLLQALRSSSAGSQQAGSGSSNTWNGDWQTSETETSYRLTQEMSLVNGDLYTVTTQGDQQTFEIAPRSNVSGGRLDLEVTFAGTIASVAGAYATKMSDRTVHIAGPLGSTPTRVQVDLSKPPAAAYWPLLVLILVAMVGGLWLTFRRLGSSARPAREPEPTKSGDVVATSPGDDAGREAPQV